jgi:hypothetical protein
VKVSHSFGVEKMFQKGYSNGMRRFISMTQTIERADGHRNAFGQPRKVISAWEGIAHPRLQSMQEE